MNMCDHKRSLIFILVSVVERQSVFVCVSACNIVSLPVCQDLLSTVQETPQSVCRRISFAHHFIAMERVHLDAHTGNTN